MRVNAPVRKNGRRKSGCFGARAIRDDLAAGTTTGPEATHAHRHRGAAVEHRLGAVVHEKNDTHRRRLCKPGAADGQAAPGQGAVRVPGAFSSSSAVSVAASSRGAGASAMRWRTAV